MNEREDDFELTEEERKFIRNLKKATKNIPERLWLFAAESGLHVVRKNENGERMFSEFDSIDQDYVIELITESFESGSW